MKDAGIAVRETETRGQVTITDVWFDWDWEPSVHDNPYKYVPAVDSVTDCVPLGATVSAQPSVVEPPVAVQEAPGEAVQVSFMGAPVVVVAALDEMAI